MTSLTLDGGTVFRGTEFIKLEITGSSNLATEAYVDTAVANGGGSGGTSTTDLSGYYNMTQTNTLLDTKCNITAVNTLLDTKLDINNPQDISGTLRLGSVDGLSKIILNAVGSNGKDFYVNGDSQVLGNLTVSSLDSTGYINVQSIQTNTYNVLNTNDIFFQSNSVPYAQFDYADDCFRFVKNLDTGNITCNGNLNINSMDTIGDVDMILKQNNVNILELKNDNRIIANQLLQCGGNLKTQEIDTLAPLDMILKVSGDSMLELKTDNRIVANKLIQCGGNIKTQEIDTIAPLDLVLKRDNVSMVELQNTLTLLNTKTECINNIVCDNFESRSLSTVSNYIMNESTGEIKFYVGSPTSPDTTTNLVMTLQNNLITFHKPTSPEIGGGTIDDSNYVKKTGETAQLIVGQTEFQGSTAQAFKFALGGPSQFAQYRRFEIYSSEIISYRVMKFTNALGLQSNLINSYTDVDLVFQRNGVEYMKFTTSGNLDVNDAVSLRSNTYDSVGNADVTFRRNFINFFHLRNNEVELASAIALNADNAKLNTINTTGDNDMVFQRNGVEYFKLDGANNIVNVGTSIALSSNYLYCNYLRTRTLATNDMIFEGANTAGNGYTEFMRLRKDEEDVMLSKDEYIIQDKRLYFHKGSSVNSYITSTNIAGANHTNFYNEDPNGDLRFYANGGIRMYITPSKVSVPPSYILEGNLVDTSDKSKKYDIKSIEQNFTDIVRQIEPKTFKMEEEKELGITKNHIGFIADEISEVIPPEWQNIVMTDNEGIKKLSYIKLSSILWGVCREQQQKIEWLESSVYELQELSKPKAKAKAKSKAE